MLAEVKSCDDVGKKTGEVGGWCTIWSSFRPRVGVRGPFWAILREARLQLPSFAQPETTNGKETRAGCTPVCGASKTASRLRLRDKGQICDELRGE
jgi:hypothetical protein